MAGSGRTHCVYDTESLQDRGFESRPPRITLMFYILDKLNNIYTYSFSHFTMASSIALLIEPFFNINVILPPLYRNRLVSIR